MAELSLPTAYRERSELGRRWARSRAAVAFVLPALVLYLVFMVWPFIQSLRLSLTDWNGATAVQPFVGLANYAELLADDLFWASLRNNLIWVVVGTAAPMVLGMIMALLLATRPKGFAVFRTFYFLPHILSPVVVGLVWNWMFNPIFGIFNKGLDAVGLEDVSRGWLGEPDVALFAVLAAAVWAEVGFVFVIFLAGLQNVSRDLLEAAMIDGANAWQRFRNVTIPQMANVITVVTALLLIGGFSVFDLIFVMTGGGPANATQVIATYTYEQAFAQNRVGYGAALSAVMTAIALVASVIFIRIRERGEG